MNPIKIMDLYEPDNGSRIAFVAKGRHDPEDFAKAIAYEFEDRIQVDQVVVRYFRWIPSRANGCCILYPSAKGKGAFLATHYEGFIEGI